MEFEPGQMIDGRYRIVRKIGQGGMGAVYEGENILIHRRVAIKILTPEPGQQVTEAALARFEREAQAAGKIGSDHILEVIDLGALQGGQRFIVMEYLDGEPLSGRIKRRGRLSPQEAAPLIHQLLSGLAAAHAAGIIHRDLKPDNVFILKEKAGKSDYVKLIDFGVSKFQGPNNAGMGMTQAGAIMGTPFYMSPEQARGAADIDARSDLYAVGVCLYEAITGRVPFPAETFNELIIKIAFEPAPPPESLAPGIDSWFSQIVIRAIAKDPGARFQTAAEFSQTLDAWMAANGIQLAQSGAHGMRPPQPSLPQMAISHGAMAQSATGTLNPWGTQSGTSAVHAPPKKSNAGLFAALGAGAFVVLAVASVGIYAVAKRGHAAAQAPVATSPVPSETGVKAETAGIEAKPSVETPAALTVEEKAPPVASTATPVASVSSAAKPVVKPVFTGTKPLTTSKPPVTSKPKPPDFGY